MNGYVLQRITVQMRPLVHPGAPHARKTQEGVAVCAYRRHGYWYG
jgi:hypothetical protein